MTRDEKAKAAHDIWAHWMKHMFSLCSEQTILSQSSSSKQMESIKTGNFIIPKAKAEQWQRLMNTEFEDLTEQEKKSDYEIADKYLNK